MYSITIGTYIMIDVALLHVCSEQHALNCTCCCRVLHCCVLNIESPATAAQ